MCYVNKDAHHETDKQVNDMRTLGHQRACNNASVKQNYKNNNDTILPRSLVDTYLTSKLTL